MEKSWRCTGEISGEYLILLYYITQVISLGDVVLCRLRFNRVNVILQKKRASIDQESVDLRFLVSFGFWGRCRSLCSLLFIMPWNYPPPSNSHHQDYYMFNRESLPKLPKPSFVTVTGWGVDLNYAPLVFSEHSRQTRAVWAQEQGQLWSEEGSGSGWRQQDLRIW